MSVNVAGLLERFGIVVTDTHGREAWALCPAHDDTKPSWSINVESGIHHCFSCGWGGNAATLVLRALDVEQLGWTARDGWEWIEDHGFADEPAGELAVELYLAAGRPAARFVLPVGVRLDVEPADWPTPARRYMATRGVTGAQVRRWGLGFAADGRLAGRIVVPVRNGRGRVCSYQARTFVDDRVRYLTPRKEEHPDATVLFGEEHWPAQRARVFVTEGAFDALAVERVTRAAVAVLSGAAHATDGLVLAKLSSFDEVVIATDPDAAGDAAWRELYAGLVRHARVRRVRMPTGQDANSLSAGALAEVLW